MKQMVLDIFSPAPFQQITTNKLQMIAEKIHFWGSLQ